MHLYQGTTQQFIGDATQARLANQLSDRFFDEFRYRPSPSEVTSWHNSLLAMANVLQVADLTDQGILVELKLPLSSKRLDVLITGSNPGTRRDSAVIVELKQWTEVGRSWITDCVTVDYGGKPRDTLHPSRQVAQYQRYLQDTHPAFGDDKAIALDACAYLHYAQHDPASPLYHADFAELLATNPAFAGNVTKTILNQCNTIFALQSFDQTGLDFLRNYMGTEYSEAISTLPIRHAILVGMASSSTRPVQFHVQDMTNRWRNDASRAGTDPGPALTTPEPTTTHVDDDEWELSEPPRRISDL